MTNKTKAAGLDPFGRVWTLKQATLRSATWPYGTGPISITPTAPR
jgi:hypothetical protein